MATRAVTQLYDDTLKPLGLRGTQFTVLAALMQTGLIKLTDLTNVLSMDRTTLTRNLKPLEEQGLIEITVGEDRRERLVSLTPQGRAVVAEALPLWEQAQTKMVQGLGAEAASTLLALLANSTQIAQGA
ncbi:MAG: MarR family transcriptional regulator [Fischerella sp.]|uniref:MarR family winged helix-turn-helix transcriptional regulator n=1 Tax=Fischerella sp. TaxID=1191 RepID=UPI00182C72E3|nr:MarR family transcriptional regulator [Fischerella sp.]NWF62088.1 MarR family transcriptional regulator [Fischerella sp.]